MYCSNVNNGGSLDSGDWMSWIFLPGLCWQMSIFLGLLLLAWKFKWTTNCNIPTELHAGRDISSTWYNCWDAKREGSWFHHVNLPDGYSSTQNHFTNFTLIQPCIFILSWQKSKEMSLTFTQSLLFHWCLFKDFHLYCIYIFYIYVFFIWKSSGNWITLELNGSSLIALKLLC